MSISHCQYIIFIDLSGSYLLHLGISIRTWKPCKAAWPCHSTSKKTHTFLFSLSSFLFHILTHSLSFSISLSSLMCCPHCVCGHVISHDTSTVCVCVVTWSHIMLPLYVCGNMISHDPPHCVCVVTWYLTVCRCACWNMTRNKWNTDCHNKDQN